MIFIAAQRRVENADQASSGRQLYPVPILGEQVGDAGQVDVSGGPVVRAADQIDNHQEAGRELRRLTGAQVLVALVFDADRGITAVRADRDGIGLAAQVGSGVGPFVVGWLEEVSGGYGLPFTLSAIVTMAVQS